MAELFKLVFLDSVPRAKKRLNRYEVALNQFLRSGRNVACITVDSDRKASTVAAAFRRTIKETGQRGVVCIKRSQQVYLKREEAYESHS